MWFGTLLASRCSTSTRWPPKHGALRSFLIPKRASFADATLCVRTPRPPWLFVRRFQPTGSDMNFDPSPTRRNLFLGETILYFKKTEVCTQ